MSQKLQLFDPIDSDGVVHIIITMKGSNALFFDTYLSILTHLAAHWHFLTLPCVVG